MMRARRRRVAGILLATYNRLPFCSALVVPSTADARATTSQLRNNSMMMLGGRRKSVQVPLLESSPYHAPSLLSARKVSRDTSSRCHLQRKRGQSSPPRVRCRFSSSASPTAGGAANSMRTAAAADTGESSAGNTWNLYDNTKCPPVPVSLMEYISLGPRYQERQQRMDKTEVPMSATKTSKHDDNAHQHQQQHQQHQQHQRADADDEHAQEDWRSAAADLAASLGIDPLKSTEAQHRRIFHLYLPVYFWLKLLLRQSRGSAASPSPSSSSSSSSSVRGVAAGVPTANKHPRFFGVGVSKRARASSSIGSNKEPPVVVGINAPQGCGKTTIVSEMQRMLEEAGHQCVVMSIDDFYLTGAEQDALAARFPTNPLLQVRGNAGTHDLALALRTIRALTRGDDGTSDGDSRDLRLSPPSSAEDPAAQDCIRVPRYDKSARGGKGDRAPKGEWSVVSTPPDVLLLEGWMLGFEALPDDSPLLLSAAEAGGGTSDGLRAVNTFLEDYQSLHDEVDAWLVLKTAEPEMVFEWRAEAERRMREAGRPGMSDEEVRDFCSRYMPAYRAYLPGLYGRCLAADAGVEKSTDGNRLGQPPQGDGGRNDIVQESLGSRKLTSGGVRARQTLVIEVGRDRNPVL
ncbi:unnamed protein product [Ectocarpus sp. 4 AP-2014]